MSRSRFLIVGMPRSGTTLLSELLSRATDATIGTETHFYPQWHARLARAIRQGDQSTVSTAAAAVLAEIGGSARALGNPPLTTPSAVLWHVLEGAMPTPGPLGEKTPRHLEWLPEILAEDPQVRVLAVVRDPRDVARSLEAVEWSTSGPGRHGWRWRRYHRMLAAALRAEPHRVLPIRFESLVRAPDRVVAAAARFVGAEPGLEDRTSGAPATFDAGSEPWKSRAVSAPDPNRAHAWSRAPGPDVAIVEAAAGGALQDAGYRSATSRIDRWRAWPVVAPQVAREILSASRRRVQRRLGRPLS